MGEQWYNSLSAATLFANSTIAIVFDWCARSQSYPGYKTISWFCSLLHCHKITEDLGHSRAPRPAGPTARTEQARGGPLQKPNQPSTSLPSSPSRISNRHQSTHHPVPRVPARRVHRHHSIPGLFQGPVSSSRPLPFYSYHSISSACMPWDAWLPNEPGGLQKYGRSTAHRSFLLIVLSTDTVSNYTFDYFL